MELYYDDKQEYFPIVTTIDSISYGPIDVNEKMRDKSTDMDLIAISNHNLTINDDHLHFSDHHTRHMQYQNKENLRHLKWTGQLDRSIGDVYKLYSLQMSNFRYEHVRKVSSLVSVFSEVGGLLNIVYLTLLFIYMYFG